MSGKRQPDAVVEIVHGADHAASNVDSSIKAVRAISQGQAFRQYSWLQNTPVLNSAGNFRGMVVSARWRVVFQVSSKVGEYAKNIGLLAGLAANVVDASSDYEAIYKSNDTWEIKGAKYSIQTSSVIFRTLAGVVPVTTHIIALSLQGYCGIADVATGSKYAAPGECVRGLRSIDAWTQTTVNKITDAKNLYWFVDTQVAPRIVKTLGY